MIAKLKEWARSAGSCILSELSDYSVKRGLIVALGALAAKHGLEQEHANVLAEAVIGGVMVALSRAQGKTMTPGQAATGNPSDSERSVQHADTTPAGEYDVR